MLCDGEGSLFEKKYSYPGLPFSQCDDRDFTDTFQMRYSPHKCMLGMRFLTRVTLRSNGVMLHPRADDRKYLKTDPLIGLIGP